MFARLLCHFRGHTIAREAKWHDGLHFRSHCQCCDTPLIRQRYGWRAWDERRDANAMRVQLSR